MDKIKQIFNGNPGSPEGNMARGRIAAGVSLATGAINGLITILTSANEPLLFSLAAILVPVAVGYWEVARQAKISLRKEVTLSSQ